MKRERTRLVADVGAELSALVAGARSVTSHAAAAFIDGADALSPSAFHVARWIDAFGAATSTAIGTGLGMDKAAVSRSISQLEGARLVVRTAHPEDARAHVVSLTREGTLRLRRVLGAKGAELDARLARFDDEELRTLASLLQRLNVRDD